MRLRLAARNRLQSCVVTSLWPVGHQSNVALSLVTVPVFTWLSVCVLQCFLSQQKLPVSAEVALLFLVCVTG